MIENSLDRDVAGLVLRDGDTGGLTPAETAQRGGVEPRNLALRVERMLRGGHEGAERALVHQRHEDVRLAPRLFVHAVEGRVFPACDELDDLVVRLVGILGFDPLAAKRDVHAAADVYVELRGAHVRCRAGGDMGRDGGRGVPVRAGLVLEGRIRRLHKPAVPGDGRNDFTGGAAGDAELLGEGLELSVDGLVDGEDAAGGERPAGVVELGEVHCVANLLRDVLDARAEDVDHGLPEGGARLVVLPYLIVGATEGEARQALRHVGLGILAVELVPVLKIDDDAAAAMGVVLDLLRVGGGAVELVERIPVDVVEGHGKLLGW